MQKNNLTQSLRWIFAPILAHRRALLAMNLIYLGAILLGIAYTAVNPAVQRTLLQGVAAALSPAGTLGPLVQAYQGGVLADAIVLTFVVNFVLGSLITITLPSLVLPFWGLVMGAIRAFLWGVLFSPVGGVFGLGMLPHALTALLEGEAYVVAMLGVWLWWQPVIRPSESRLRAWWRGLILQGRVYLAVALLLALAAAYEAFEVIYILPRTAG